MSSGEPKLELRLTCLRRALVEEAEGEVAVGLVAVVEVVAVRAALLIWLASVASGAMYLPSPSNSCSCIACTSCEVRDAQMAIALRGTYVVLVE